MPTSAGRVRGRGKRALGPRFEEARVVRPRRACTLTDSARNHALDECHGLYAVALRVDARLVGADAAHARDHAPHHA